MLRKFDESSLFEIQIKKFQKLTNNFNVYCAVGEKPFLTILKNYKKIKLITRNKISIESDLIVAKTQGKSLHHSWYLVSAGGSTRFIVDRKQFETVS